jgi:DNA sulfur modification protein DndD
MIIETLTINNFRQFRGKSTLRFAHGKKNVTVIFGENGRGKTGIFRALMFCLFGDRQLSQDELVDDREVHLVNNGAMRDSQQEKGRTVEAGVELTFKHNDCRYTLRRTVQGLWHNGERHEEEKEVTLSIEKPNGNCAPVRDPENIKEMMGGVIDYRVREYFLFDGEKIEHLTRASQHQRTEVSKGVRNLLNIDGLEIATKALKHVGKEFARELEKSATGELARTMKRLNESTAKRDTLDEQIAALAADIQKAEEEIEDLEKKLKKHRGITQLVEQRERLNGQIRDVEQEMQDLRAVVRDKVARTAILLCMDPIRSVYEDIEKRRKKGEIPPEIRQDLIERLLSEQKCICGREIRPGTPEHTQLKEWLRKVGDPELSDSALEMWRSLSGIMSQEETVRSNAETTLQHFGRKNSELERLRRQLSTVTAKIGEDVRDDAIHWEDQRKKAETAVRKKSVEKERLEETREELDAAIRQLEAQKVQLEKERGIANEMSARHSLVESARQALVDVADAFTKEARETIAAQATAYFQTFLDANSQGLFDRIEVNKDYSLQIMDKHGNAVLANISAGQRQLMSIAFIAALARTAADGDLLQMPLFMDTPFGRLSLDHRLSLIDNLPKLCAQWILLATDTELRRSEARHLYESKRWGRFYRLVSTPGGETEVEEKSTEDALTLIREEEEGES